MAREPKPGVRRNPETVTHTCFPSIDRIAADTTLSEKTVRRALGYLVQWGLVTKSILPHHKPMIGRHPEKYYGRRYHVVAEVWDAAESEAAVPTVEMAQSSPEDLATLDRLDDPIVRTSTSPVPVPTVVAPVTKHSLTAVQQRMFIGIAALLRERLGSHPTYKHKDADKIMSRCINDCCFLSRWKRRGFQLRSKQCWTHLVLWKNAKIPGFLGAT